MTQEEKWGEDDKIAVAIDIVVFTIEGGELKVLLAERQREPFKNKLTLAGCFVKFGETFEDAVARALRTKAGIENIRYVEQLYTFGEIRRDVRERVISVAYFALVKPGELRVDQSKAKLVSTQNVPELGFDHNRILNYAIQRLRWKLEYTTVAFTLLPQCFKLSELQDVYEVILGKKLDKRNFRRRILPLGIIEKTSEKESGVSHKPATYYTFTGKIGDIINIF